MFVLFRDEDRFREKNFQNVDKNNTAFLYLHTTYTWMGIRLVQHIFVSCHFTCRKEKKIASFRLRERKAAKLSVALKTMFRVQGECGTWGLFFYPRKTQNSAFCCDALRFSNAKKCSTSKPAASRCASRQNLLSGAVVFVATVCSVASGLLGHISAAMVGLAVTYAMNVSGRIPAQVEGRCVGESTH